MYFILCWKIWELKYYCILFIYLFFVLLHFKGHSYLKFISHKNRSEISLRVQWLRLNPSTAEGMGSIPGQGTRVLHALQCG